MVRCCGGDWETKTVMRIEVNLIKIIKGIKGWMIILMDLTTIQHSIEEQLKLRHTNLWFKWWSTPSTKRMFVLTII